MRIMGFYLNFTSLDAEVSRVSVCCEKFFWCESEAELFVVWVLSWFLYGVWGAVCVCFLCC